MHLQIEEQDAQFHFRQLKFDFWTIWKNFINTIRHFFRWGSQKISHFTVCMTTYPIKFTYLESWALDLSPTQIIPTLSRLFFSSNSFLIVLQIDEWTPPHNPRSDVNATYSVWNEIKGYHLNFFGCFEANLMASLMSIWVFFYLSTLRCCFCFFNFCLLVKCLSTSAVWSSRL